MGRGQHRTDWMKELPEPLQPERGHCPPFGPLLQKHRYARTASCQTRKLSGKAPQNQATEGLSTWQTARETRVGSAGACFGGGSDPTTQPPFPARQRHTRELRVISFPVVKWSKCVSMQDWGPGNHEENGFLFLLQTTAAPVDYCSNASFPQRRTWSWDFKFL